MSKRQLQTFTIIHTTTVMREVMEHDVKDRRSLNGIHFDILHQREASVLGLGMNTFCSKCACLS